MLVQIFYFKASMDMEENQVKDEESRGTLSGGGWLNINELSALLCELDAVATQVGNIF